MKKRIASMILALLMIMTLIPLSSGNAYAGSDAEAAGDTAWVEFSNETMLLKGTGEIWDALHLKVSQVAQLKDTIEEVYIGNGITGLGNWNFCFPNLKRIWIPDSVTSIGGNCFSGVSNLETVWYRGYKDTFDKLTADIINPTYPLKIALEQAQVIAFNDDPEARFRLRLDEVDEAGIPCIRIRDYKANYMVEMSLEGAGVYMDPNGCMDLDGDSTPDLQIVRYNGLYDVYYAACSGGSTGLAFNKSVLNEYMMRSLFYDQRLPFWHYLEIYIPVSLQDQSRVTVSLDADEFIYTGKKIKPAVTVWNGSNELVKGTDYKVSYKNNKNAGTGSMTVTGIGKYSGQVTREFTINKAANTLSVKSKTASVKYSKLKTADQTLAVSKVRTLTDKGQGTKSYSLVSAKKSSKSFKKYFSVDKTSGKVTVKKGLKKGTYSVKLRVSAAGTKNYESAEKTITAKIKVE